MTERSKRPHDIVLWGATGHTGRLVAKELLKGQKNKQYTWALGGRNEKRLLALSQELAKLDESAPEIPIILGNSLDQASLDNIADQTRVVCSAAGPFALYGSGLVDACVRHGTHYCDTTGEVGWVREMIAAHHDEATERGVRIVPFCGVDSVPSDLACLMLHDHFHRTRDAKLSKVNCYVTAWKGGYSGGTYGSMLESWTRLARDPVARSTIADPYSLNSNGSRTGDDKAEGLAARWDKELKQWVGMFLMAGVNTRVVRRTWELLDGEYSEDFSYREEKAFGNGARGWLGANRESFRWFSLMLAAMAPPTRWLLRKLLPAPGEGPSQSERDAGCFAFELHAAGEPNNGDGTPRAIGRVSAELDTYGVTGIIAALAATHLAEECNSKTSGLLTPAAAFGMPLVQDLRKAGFTFDVTPS